MKGVYSYLANDGICHWWDVANRGGIPLCGKDVFFLNDQRVSEQMMFVPSACDHCVSVMRTMLEWEDYQERG